VNLALSVPPTPQALAPTRHTVRDWLAGAGYAGPGANDVLLVISELVTNGIIHDGGTEIELCVDLDDANGIAIEVITIDHPPGRGPPNLRSSSDPAESGRGLVVVDALTDTLSVEHRGRRRHVKCHMTINDGFGGAALLRLA
jgi:anti-sigma regulatory factor (Ser/Thr protein kinase)